MSKTNYKMKSSFYQTLSIYDLILLLGFIGITLFLIMNLFLFNENNRAIIYMTQKKYEEAEGILLKNLNKNFSLLYRMNLAFNYTLSSQYEKSIQEYQVIKRLLNNGNDNHKTTNVLLKQSEDRTQNFQKKSVLVQKNRQKDLLFYTSFNSAFASAQKGEINRALSFYQQALHIKSNSLETKINIELLTKAADEQNQQNKKEDSPINKEPHSSQEKKDPNNSFSDETLKNKTAQSEEKDQFEIPEDQKPNEGTSLTDKEEKEIFNKKQVEAILKSIQDQEREIRRRRMEGERQNPDKIPYNKKDW